MNGYTHPVLLPWTSTGGVVHDGRRRSRRRPARQGARPAARGEEGSLHVWKRSRGGQDGERAREQGRGDEGKRGRGERGGPNEYGGGRGGTAAALGLSHATCLGPKCGLGIGLQLAPPPSYCTLTLDTCVAITPSSMMDGCPPCPLLYTDHRWQRARCTVLCLATTPTRNE